MQLITHKVYKSKAPLWPCAQLTFSSKVSSQSLKPMLALSHTSQKGKVTVFSCCSVSLKSAASFSPRCVYVQKRKKKELYFINPTRGSSVTRSVYYYKCMKHTCMCIEREVTESGQWAAPYTKFDTHAQWYLSSALKVFWNLSCLSA